MLATSTTYDSETLTTDSDQLNMSTSRLFRFPKPEWLNSPNTRTAGVYLAGALVGLASRSHLTVISGSDSRITVLTRILLLH